MLHEILVPNLQNIDLFSVAVTIAAIGVLGFTVLLENTKSITNRTFFYLSLSIISWSAVNYVAYQFRSEIVTLWLLRLVIFFATWFAFMVFVFLFVFPEKDKRFPQWFKFVFIPLAIITSILSLTPLVFKEIAEMSPTGGASRVINGVGIIIFGLTVLTFNAGGIVSLFKKTLKADNASKPAYQHILTGVFITLTLIVVLNFIFPAFFNNPSFIPLGAVFIFPFVAFTSYAILRHKLFNIRVAGTAVLVFLLSVVTFSEVILARDIAIIIYRSSIFILVLTFGVFLIRGVMKEVEQREALQKLSEQLEISNVKLEAAYEKLNRLSKAKSEFISIASHQLRTPLSAIKGYISMLVEGTYGKVSERMKRPLQNVFKSNERLINLVNNLLDISRIEAGKMEFEPEQASVEEIINSVVQELKITAEQKKLYLKYYKPKTPLPKLFLDREKIRQVFLNLLNNAIKYTNKGGITIKSEIRRSLRTSLSSPPAPAPKLARYPKSEISRKIVVEIKDTGEGMTKEDLGKIFETFSRGTIGAQISAEGAGLGLYIARKFVEMHKGRVWAESEGKSKGSTFYVELPIKK